MSQRSHGEGLTAEIAASPHDIERLRFTLVARIMEDGRHYDPDTGGAGSWYIVGEPDVNETYHLEYSPPASGHVIKDLELDIVVPGGIARIIHQAEPTYEALSETELHYPIEREEIWLREKTDGNLAATRRHILIDRPNPKSQAVQGVNDWVVFEANERERRQEDIKKFALPQDEEELSQRRLDELVVIIAHQLEREG